MQNFDGKHVHFSPRIFPPKYNHPSFVFWCCVFGNSNLFDTQHFIRHFFLEDPLGGPGPDPKVNRTFWPIVLFVHPVVFVGPKNENIRAIFAWLDQPRQQTLPPGHWFLFSATLLVLVFEGLRGCSTRLQGFGFQLAQWCRTPTPWKGGSVPGLLSGKFP